MCVQKKRKKRMKQKAERKCFQKRSTIPTNVIGSVRSFIASRYKYYVRVGIFFAFHFIDRFVNVVSVNLTICIAF